MIAFHRSSARLLILAATTVFFASACIRANGGSATSTVASPSAGEGASAASEPFPQFPEIVHADRMLRGISLAGADFGEGTLPGSHGKEYVYPDAKYANGYASPAYFKKKGMNVFRLPFRWERLQPERNKVFDAAELERLQTTVSDLRALGVKVILDPHNY